MYIKNLTPYQAVICIKCCFLFFINFANSAFDSHWTRRYNKLSFGTRYFWYVV